MCHTVNGLYGSHRAAQNLLLWILALLYGSSTAPPATGHVSPSTRRAPRPRLTRSRPLLIVWAPNSGVAENCSGTDSTPSMRRQATITAEAALGIMRFFDAARPGIIIGLKNSRIVRSRKLHKTGTRGKSRTNPNCRTALTSPCGPGHSKWFRTVPRHSKRSEQSRTIE